MAHRRSCQLAIPALCLAVLKEDYSNLAPVRVVRFAGNLFWPLVAWLHPIWLVDWMKYAAGWLNSARRIDRLWLSLRFDTRWIAKLSDPEINYGTNFVPMQR
jgi:hypothetical protein